MRFIFRISRPLFTWSAILRQVVLGSAHPPLLQSSFPSLSSRAWFCPSTSASVFLSFSVKSCLVLPIHLCFSLPFLLYQVVLGSAHPPLLQSSFPSLSSRAWFCPSTSASVFLSFSIKSCLVLPIHLRFSLPFLLFPDTSVTITRLQTYLLSLLNACPHHFTLLSFTVWIFLPLLWSF